MSAELCCPRWEELVPSRSSFISHDPLFPLTVPQQNRTNHCQSSRPNNPPSLCVWNVTELNVSFSDCPSCRTGATATTDGRFWPTSRSPRTLWDHYEDSTQGLPVFWHFVLVRIRVILTVRGTSAAETGFLLLIQASGSQDARTWSVVRRCKFSGNHGGSREKPLLLFKLHDWIQTGIFRRRDSLEQSRSY